MTLAATAWALDQENISTTEKIVLVVLAEYTNPDSNEVWPSHKTIQRRTSIKCKSTLTKALKSLEEMGLIRKTRRTDSRGRDTSNLYELMVGGVYSVDPRGSNDYTQGGLTTRPSYRTDKKEQTIEQEYVRFWEFFNSYPKRKGADPRKPAKVAWEKAIKSKPPGDIIQAAKKYAASQPDPKYIPMASTWLNQERYDDDIADERSWIDKRLDEIDGKGDFDGAEIDLEPGSYTSRH
jgi:hypothetical protein